MDILRLNFDRLREAPLLLLLLPALMVPVVAGAQTQPVKLPALAALSTVKVGCTWSESEDAKGKNTGFRDSAAAYYTAMLPTGPNDGTYYEISGKFPRARYFSFQTYDGERIGNFIDSLPDSLIHPMGLEGSPLQLKPAPLPNAGNYTYRYLAKAIYADPPADPAARESNTVYLRPGSSSGAVVKQLGLRVYLPNPGVSATGGVALPTITYVGPLGRIDLANTPDKATCANGQALIDATSGGGTPFISVGSTTPKFQVVGTTFVIYPNGDALYMQTDVRNDHADMAIVRAKAPVVPVLPPLAQPAATVRYWSACVYDLATSDIAACLVDRNAVLQADGYYVFVMSTAAKRPPSATAANKINWLPWGASTDSRFGLRQILANPDFPGNYNRALAAPLTPYETTLGVWAPEITFCDTATYTAMVRQGGSALMAACAAAFPNPTTLPPIKLPISIISK